jgi:cation:H+ antiporter
MIPINYNHTSNARTSSNIAYREGSLYHAASDIPYFLTAVIILRTGVIVLGMLRCERRGAANIGFESALIFVLYLGGTAVLVATS